MPKVSVIIDTYNHGRYIEQAVESVLEQGISPPDLELIVVDDGSTDDTSTRLQKFANTLIYLQKANGGQASALNLAIPHASGEIVSFLDADDWWAPGKLAAVTKAMADNPEVGAVGHGFVQVDDDSRTSQVHLPEGDQRLRLRTAADARIFLRNRCFLGTSRLTVRSHVLRKILPIPEPLVIEADEYLFTMAAALADVALIAQPLFFYRIHEGNLYQFREQDDVKLRRKLNVHECLLRHLPQRLCEIGISAEAAEAIRQCHEIEVGQMRLATDGGRRAQTLQVEAALRAGRLAAGEPPSSVIKLLSQLCAMVFPPKTFYAFKAMYSRWRHLARLNRR
jgi:glycosyltransferase involved in cell wall biosynthesis